MKKLIRLTEQDIHRIIKESITRVLNENGWVWPKYGLSDEELEACKEKVRDYAISLYPELRPCDRIEQLFRDTYRGFCSQSSNWSEEKIDKEYDRVIGIIDKYGFAMAEYNGFGQGWWHYVSWLIDNKK